MQFSRMLGVVACAAALAACSEDDLVENFSAALNGANEVPAVVTAATATASLALTEGVLTYTVTATGLSGVVTAAHIHVGAVGAEGPPVLTLTHASVASGTVASGTSATGLAVGVTADSLFTLLRNGNAYVNLHTAANVDGEVRGQVN